MRKTPLVCLFVLLFFTLTVQIKGSCDSSTNVFQAPHHIYRITQNSLVEIDRPSDIEMERGVSERYLSWIGRAFWTFDYQVHQNDSLIQSGNINMGTVDISVPLDDLAVGSHYFTLNVYFDDEVLLFSDEVLVKVVSPVADELSITDIGFSFLLGAIVAVPSIAVLKYIVIKEKKRVEENELNRDSFMKHYPLVLELLSEETKDDTKCVDTHEECN